jgi:RimJ/RimL family protein N-acetyltransferase
VTRRGARYARPVPSIPERITTARLLLRCWETSDAPALRAAIDASLDQLREWLPWAIAEPTPVEELAIRLEGFAHRFRAGEDWVFGVFDLRSGAVLGGAGLHRREASDALEIGYWLRADAVGRGLATEAVEALARTALAPGGPTRVEIRCDPTNARSIAVARRTGFRHLRTLVAQARTPGGEPRDTMVWERGYFVDPDGPAAGGG